MGADIDRFVILQGLFKRKILKFFFNLFEITKPCKQKYNFKNNSF